MNEHLTNRLLGHPADARLLIINCDDFGMCHSGNEGTLRALTDGIATSTTLMAPCPWAPHAMQLLREYPEISFGVHLTVICDPRVYRWGPLSSKNTVPSLIDGAGYFFSNALLPGLLDRFRTEEVALEFRAQIETVLAAGLAPTHLDWHCLANGGRPDIFAATLALAREYGLALRIHDRSEADSLQSRSLPANDHGVLDSYALEPSGKDQRYAQLLRKLPAGLSEWAVHPSLGDAEARALEPSSWQVRSTDLDFLISPEARAIIEEEGIILMDYRALQQVWNAQDGVTG